MLDVAYAVAVADPTVTVTVPVPVSTTIATAPAPTTIATARPAALALPATRPGLGPADSAGLSRVADARRDLPSEATRDTGHRALNPIAHGVKGHYGHHGDQDQQER